MSKKLLLSLALVMLVQGSLVLALDCSKISFSNTLLCQEILQSNLTLVEKEALISSLEYNSTYFPDHNYISLRNNALVVKDAPLSVKTYNGAVIKNAWASLFSLMPSVIYNNSLFSPQKTSVLTGFSYDIVLPLDYSSSGYPSTNQGDCRREYGLVDSSSENKVFTNGDYQGSGKLVTAILSRDSNVSAIFDINVDYSIRHYAWNKYCCGSSKTGCSKYCYSCDQSNVESKNDKLSLTDSLNVRLYNNTLNAEVVPIDAYGTTNKLRINYSDSIELNFNNSYFYFYKYIFSINYSKEPYYIFTLKAEDYPTEKVSNLFRTGNEITVKNNLDCKVRAFDLFKVIQANCNSNYLGFDFNISADKFYYSDNQTIKIDIFPKNISLNITYGDQNKYAIGNTVLVAQYPSNKITAYYEDKKYEKLIFVYDKSKILLLWESFLFFLLVYLFYKILNKYYRRAHGG
jgi:hypothetical protein